MLNFSDSKIIFVTFSSISGESGQIQKFSRILMMIDAPPPPPCILQRKDPLDTNLLLITRIKIELVQQHNLKKLS